MVPNFTLSKSGKDSPGLVTEISDPEVKDVWTVQNLPAETAPAEVEAGYTNLRRERLPEKSGTRNRGIVYGGVDQPSALGVDLKGLIENPIDHRRTRYILGWPG